MIFTVFADGHLDLGPRIVRCALGVGGVSSTLVKREGDGRTPEGVWPLRRLLWRADRVAAPATRLPASALRPDDGWCDAPGDRNYNRPVTLPYGASAERLWREDGLYDLVVVLGYNDAPVAADAGSAIFLHLATPDFAPTQGCVAMAEPDMRELLAICDPGDALAITTVPLTC